MGEMVLLAVVGAGEGAPAHGCCQRRTPIAAAATAPRAIQRPGPRRGSEAKRTVPLGVGRRGSLEPPVPSMGIEPVAGTVASGTASRSARRISRADW